MRISLYEEIHFAYSLMSKRHNHAVLAGISRVFTMHCHFGAEYFQAEKRTDKFTGIALR